MINSAYSPTEAELAVQAGIPPGVFNVVPGFGHEAGEPCFCFWCVQGLHKSLVQALNHRGRRTRWCDQAPPRID